MISPINSIGKGKSLSPEDTTTIRHYFMMCYGWISDKEWDEIPIDFILEFWEKVNDEIRKKEELRLASLSFYGVKNPK